MIGAHPARTDLCDNFEWAQPLARSEWPVGAIIGMKRRRQGIGFALVMLGGFAQPAAQAAQSRLRPPDAVTCPRNDLTLYAGRVLSLDRQKDTTSLTIATDWKTTERVTIKHAGATDPIASLLMKGKPFTKDDWTVIAPGGKLRDGVRANAWVCRDGRTVVDWEGVVPRSVENSGEVGETTSGVVF